LPSINKSSAWVFSFSTALCIAKKEAFRIFILSISFGLTIPTAHAIASLSMIGRNKSLFLSDNTLLSFSNLFLKLLGRITAAATTGPARQPLPASSQPATICLEGKCVSSCIDISI